MHLYVACSRVHKYLQKSPGPLLDSIDMHIEVPRLKHDELTAPLAGEHSDAVRARARQAKRFAADRLRP
jgi:magnesium chelatase family protein